MSIDVSKLIEKIGDSVLLLPSSVSFVVPSTMAHDKPITAAEFSARTTAISAKFTDLFGGATITDGNGFDPHNPNGEDVQIVQSFSDSAMLADNFPALLALARDCLGKWEQGSILLVIDGQGLLIFD